jgi:hypothetical protein
MLSGQTLGGGSQLPIRFSPNQPASGVSLANSGSQISFANKQQSWIFDASLAFGPFFGAIHPQVSSSKLADLKRKAFPEIGRTERIAKSLAAVNAAQSTCLSSSEWKRIAEADIEDQY